MRHCVAALLGASAHLLNPLRLGGCWELLGLDFMLDDAGGLYLIEVSGTGASGGEAVSGTGANEHASKGQLPRRRAGLGCVPVVGCWGPRGNASSRTQPTSCTV